MKYYLFKKRICRKEQYYELISTYDNLEDAKQSRYIIILPFIEKKNQNLEDWIKEEYPIRKKGDFRVRYIF